MVNVCQLSNIATEYFFKWLKDQLLKKHFDWILHCQDKGIVRFCLEEKKNKEGGSSWIIKEAVVEDKTITETLKL